MRKRNAAVLHGFGLFGSWALAGEALADWGENWGTMSWSASPTAVPTLEVLGLSLLAMGLSGAAAWVLRRRRPALGLSVLLVGLAIPLAVAAGTLSVPNTFTNGTPADANQVNANFDAVLIDSSGQLGTVSSSARVKEDVAPMAERSRLLAALRPVTFLYKEPFADGEKPLQFGLIAEQVVEVFPELVVVDEQGKPETVKYHLLSSLLLNEFQQLSKRHEAFRAEAYAELAALRAEMEQRLARVEALSARLARLEARDPIRVASVEAGLRR